MQERDGMEEGSLKYDHKNNRAYFYTTHKTLLLQKVMTREEVKEGVVFESTKGVIQICEHLDSLHRDKLTIKNATEGTMV